MFSSFFDTAKPRVSLALRTATLTAMLLATLPATFAHAASNTFAGPPTVTVSADDSGVYNQPLAASVTISNNTAAPITSAILGMSFVGQISGPLSNTTLCARERNAGTTTGVGCNIGTLNPGDSFTLSLSIKPSSEGTLSIFGSGTGYVNGVWSRSTTTLGVPIAPALTDVQISGSVSTGSPAAGNNFHYNYQVRNSGSYVAHSVTFADALPDGLTLIGANTSNSAPCTVSGNSISCNLGEMAVGSQVLINVGVTASPAPGTFTNTASANATNGDTQPNNNSVNITVQVR
ncbi:MAG: DUF11 domain-containing protein [Chloroflexota bacterium]|nr:DUF11 domain-containing protein [Chloroflexota bacterium]